MPSWVLLVSAMCLGVLQSAGDCPSSCDCKWKSGKESVLCAGRNMTGVPQYLDSGTQLLDLSSNNLTAIHEDEFSTAQLINLQKVFLSRCSLRYLHRSAFHNLINLVDLDLSFNLLSTVPSHTFEFIPLLTELKLNGNPIAIVKSNSFKSVPHLNKLDLSECMITFIESHAFTGLDNSLEWLKLDKNRMTNIRGESVMQLGNLKGLELAGNPWNCTCGLRALREWVLRYNIPHTISPMCKQPERLAGKLWDKLDLDEFACLPRVATSKEKNGQEGDNVTLICIIRSVPVPAVRWLKKEKTIANLTGLHSGGKHLFTIKVARTGSNLTITSAEIADSGEYTCRAENKAGKSEARINLIITVKPEEPVWTTRVVIATAAVVILFTIAAVLLLICIYFLWKRQQRFHLHAAVSSRADVYEMNHKTVNNYDKVIRYGSDAKSDDNYEGRVRECRNGYVSSAEAEVADLSMRAVEGNGRTWGAARRNSQVQEETSPDLHIPRINQTRCDDGRIVGSPHLSPAAELLVATPGVRTHMMRKEVRGPNLGTLYTSAKDKDNYPDLLETDKNTLPRRGYRQRRNRTGSCGSESTSPLLQGSSDGSNDSTPMPLLDIPDPYPELDKFLKEYRNLQEQLYKMKESCENLKQENLRFKAESSGEPQTISRLMDDVYKVGDVEPMYSVYSSTTAVEPLYNTSQHLLNDTLGNVLLSASIDNNNPTTDEMSQIKNDPYWLTRRKILSSYASESSSNPSKSFFES